VSHELRFERVFDARPEEVFDAFTDPAGLEEMYGLDEPGWVVESEGDVGVGGTWSVAFGPSRGELYVFRHEFEVIERPKRVVFRSNEMDPDGSSFDAIVEVTFEEEGAKTLMTLVERGFPSAESRDQHELGLPHAFDRVERFLRAKAAERHDGRSKR
jgi:uncharacterized protein YndB with AHSA1/START domain